ncbi:uncharacterized protein LOC129727427 [Wyeomyia smithii]|uniref:uncharacterized protein LOC129727427 n=1 Tax=Wyeomyia smithii TaxID=174621 RepID=UPI002467FD96|nr:uncharacterized protein LOC129727427 [Wyeomyia smithii]
MQSRFCNSSICVVEDLQCRLCLSSEEDLQPLFPPGANCVLNDLLSRIYDCLNVHVSFLEDFCSVICKKCREEVNAFYNFKKQCQTNDDYLRRKRHKDGAEFERMQPEDFRNLKAVHNSNMDQKIIVQEPDDNTLLNQTKEMFLPTNSKTSKTLAANQKYSSKQIQTFNESSSDTFYGCSLDSHRRSPRIFINNSIKEAFELQSPPPASDSLNEVQECGLSLEVLDVKLDLEELDEGANVSKSSLQKKDVKPALFYDGFQYGRPKKKENGSTLWSCCQLSCPARLVKSTDEKITLSKELHQHRPQVERDGTIYNITQKRHVRYTLARLSKHQSFIYNDSYRYYLKQNLPKNQSLWICQRYGCKASVRVSKNFQRIACTSRHNHPEDKIVFRNDEKKRFSKAKHNGATEKYH